MQAAAKERKSAEQRPAEIPTTVRSELRDEDTAIDVAAEVDYLIDRGWKKVALGDSANPLKRWLDPNTGKPDRKVLVVPESRDAAGRVKTPAVYQNYCGVPPWYYNRREAVAEQRDRDREAVAKGK
jgi:hypothetical protein